MTNASAMGKDNGQFKPLISIGNQLGYRWAMYKGRTMGKCAVVVSMGINVSKAYKGQDSILKLGTE